MRLPILSFGTGLCSFVLISDNVSRNSCMKHAGSLESTKDACVRASFLGALQPSQVLFISMTARLMHEPIVL